LLPLPVFQFHKERRPICRPQIVNDTSGMWMDSRAERDARVDPPPLLARSVADCGSLRIPPPGVATDKTGFFRAIPIAGFTPP